MEYELNRWELESALKLEYAKDNKITPETWASADFMSWRTEKMKQYHKNFAEFLDKDHSLHNHFFENMAEHGNSVYVKNMENKFLISNGIKTSLGSKIKNYLKLNKLEANGEYGEYSAPLGRMKGLLAPMKPAYRLGHIIERGGAKLFKAGVKLCKNKKYAPLAQLAGVACMAYGAEFVVLGAVVKTGANPYYLTEKTLKALKSKKKENPSKPAVEAKDIQKQQEPSRGRFLSRQRFRQLQGLDIAAPMREKNKGSENSRNAQANALAMAKISSIRKLKEY